MCQMYLILTAKRWQTVTDRPMVRGAEPFRSVLLESTLAYTVKTRTKVIINSTPKACWAERYGLGVVVPKAPW